MQDQYQHTVDGQTVAEDDINLIAREAALADDYALAELLRLAPFDGTNYAKAILPYFVAGSNTCMVQPNGATGSVKLLPFKAVLGTRTAISGTSTGSADDSARANWRSIRSQVYAPSDDGATLGHAVAFAAGDPSFPRWDLVYVQIAVDQDSATVSRSVWPPAATSATTENVVATKTTTLTINVVAGTPGASPAVPSLPADTPGSGLFNIPLAAVQIPSGFGAFNTIAPQQIMMLAPTVAVASSLGVARMAPASAFSTGLSSTQQLAWGSSGSRPAEAMAQTMRGGKTIFFAIDATTASPSVADGGVIDNSIDWRKRYFSARGVATNVPSATIAHVHAPALAVVPSAALISTGGNRLECDSHSFVDDSVTVIGTAGRGAVVWYATNASLSQIASGSNAIGFCVDMSTGALKLYYQGTPGVKLWMRIDATGPLDNV